MEKTINVVFAIIFGLISLVSLYVAVFEHATHHYFSSAATGLLSLLIIRDLVKTRKDDFLKKPLR